MNQDQQLREPQAQACHLHLKPPFEDENGNDISGWYITLQSHREAMADMRQVVDALLLDQKRNQVRTAKKDAALKAQNAVLTRYRNETPLGHQQHMIAHVADAAITQAEGAMK